MTKKTIVLVLRTGKDFQFSDVLLIQRHINAKWKSEIKPNIVCFFDMCSVPYDFGNMQILPLMNDWPGTWSRMDLYNPMYNDLKPFLYIDLDTAIIDSVENIFDLVTDESKFICLDDFWQPGKLATGLVWFPKDCEKTNKVWKEWQRSGPRGNRMDYFLRSHIKPDLFWQQLTTKIYDFKPKRNSLLNELPSDATMVCFHGKPRICEVNDIKWVTNYINEV